MTTTISLAARDFIVVGCDSLATSVADLVSTIELDNEFFEADGSLKLNTEGKPLLVNNEQLWSRSRMLPIDQLPSVTKLFDLKPYNASALFSGASRIGETTVKSIVETFIAKHESNREVKYTMEDLATWFKEHVMTIYEEEFPVDFHRPMMETILSGYSTDFREPEIWRLTFRYDRATGTFDCPVNNQVPRKSYNVIFGGQYDVISRVVNGIDVPSYWNLRERIAKRFKEYHDSIVQTVQSAHPNFSISEPNFYSEEFDVFKEGNGGVSSLSSDIGSLSEQAGIDFVYFLVSVMIKSQQFSSSLSTVGGDIHIAILSKGASFRWISKESYHFENERIPKFSLAI